MRRTHLSQLRRSIVAVMQSTDSRTRHDEAGTCRRSSTGGRSLLQSEMRSILMVIAEVLRKQPLQMPFVQRNHVIEEITSAAFHPTLSDAVLPRTLKRGPEGSEPERSNRRRNLEPVFPVPIKEQESESRAERKRLAELLDHPKACGVLRHIEVQDPSSVMGDDKETVDDAESDGGDREEVHCSDHFSMIAQKGKPAPSRLGVPWSTLHPTGDSSFREVETEHEQLPVNARCAPSWILADHSEDQFPHLFGSRLSSRGSSNPRNQPPVHSEAGPMPADDSFGRHDDERLLPPGPESTDGNPEDLVHELKVRTRASSFQDGELLAKHEVF